ncbi:MAG: carboxymuconolactone decarboxylase family protein [Nitrospira sp.]|nr:carboxymuconolactone decarboxylase family protein [Nitrospira sp.]
MRFKIHTSFTAPQDSRRILKEIEEKYGFLPNFFGVLAESPAAVQSYTAVSDALQHCMLTPVEQQIVALTISVTTDCAYCVADHSILAQKVGVTEKVLSELRAQKPLSDKKLNALRTLVLSVMNHRGWVPNEDLEQFAKAGYTERHVLEVITFLALKIMSNYVNQVAKTPLDSRLASQVGSPKAITSA